MSNARNIASGAKFVDTAGDNMTGDLTISSTAGQLKLTDTDGTEQNTTIKQSGGNLFIQSRDNTNNAGVVFAGNGGGNYSEHMRINASGRVTMPHQPNISITLNSNNAINWTSAQAIFATSSVTTDTQVGITHNTSNGRFTVPVAGRYYFSFFTIVNGAGVSWINFLHNGTRRADAYEDDGANWRTMSSCAIYNMAANDYIEPYAANPAKTVGDAHGMYHMRFTMHLLG